MRTHPTLILAFFGLPVALLAGCTPQKVSLGDDTAAETHDSVANPNDVDGDGYDSLASGGDDCDDTNAAINPGATEVWYDGIDENCDGADDYDQDGDGHEASQYVNSGDDCDDTNPTVYVGASEVDNGIDDDCDGAIDEDFVKPNDVIITEIMTHPLALSERDAEWFEVLNVSTRDIDLKEWTIVSGSESAVINASVPIPAGARVVLAANISDSANGGVGAAYGYDGNIVQLDDADELGLQINNTTIFDVSWDATWPVLAGSSMTLDPDHDVASEARSGAWWCNPATRMADGDYGTPNAANDQCLTIDEDGDGYTQAEGDCNDGSPLVHPGAPDVWDNLDNDCDGIIDDGVASEVASGTFIGSNNSYLGSSGVATGDFDGDGQDDLVISTSAAGYVYVVSGRDVSGADGPVTDYDEANVSTGAYYGAGIGPALGDQTGDGSPDLVCGVYDYYGGTKADIFEGNGAHAGSMSVGDTWGKLTGGATSYGGAIPFANLDFDGDGVDDIVLAEPYASTSSSAYYRGVVYVVSGADANTDYDLDDAAGRLEGETYGDYFGIGVGGGDLDGDGHPELILGAPDQDGNGTNSGAWYVFTDAFQKGSGESTADWIIRGNNDNDETGYGQALVVDLDGNGQNDLVLGSFGVDEAYVFMDAGVQSGEDVAGAADVVMKGDGGSSFGFSLSAGDFTGDGQYDLAVSAPALSSSATPAYWYTYAGSATDHVYFYTGDQFGRGDLSTADATASVGTSGTWDALGGRLSSAGDFGGDGIDDIGIAAPRGDSAAGEVFAIEGR